MKLQIRTSTQAYFASARDATRFARDWRNRRIAHTDLGLALAHSVPPLEAASRHDIEAALDAIVDLLNHVALHYGRDVTNFDMSHGAGAVRLLYVIRDGLDARAARKQRLLEGRPLPEDIGPPKEL